MNIIKNLYKLNNEYYILTWYKINNKWHVHLVSLDDGNRYNDPVKIGELGLGTKILECITPKMWEEITGGKNFIKIKTKGYLKTNT